MKIKQTECHSDRIRTDAVLRGVRFIDYGQLITETSADLEQLRKMHKKHGLQDIKSIKELENKLESQELLIREWILKAGFKHRTRDYVVTILVEEIPDKE